ncbi:hypothetical protein [Sphingomonas nostoxanthinifaciens]|uniref:hypothetical protein n=1 Tax=Sphingomonas nostoxanthinifaciens TaxID=2872652 RepID=UPI001CC21AFA|nr:hypothetical protein [Sphingomonas nostoxanthinifaciens]UAK23870.1 hypothetical protein K8P63_16085 [Sphingomonas nostoxanthinifaciens]
MLILFRAVCFVAAVWREMGGGSAAATARHRAAASGLVAGHERFPDAGVFGRASRHLDVALVVQAALRALCADHLQQGARRFRAVSLLVMQPEEGARSLARKASLP